MFLYSRLNLRSCSRFMFSPTGFPWSFTFSNVKEITCFTLEFVNNAWVSDGLSFGFLNIPPNVVSGLYAVLILAPCSQDSVDSLRNAFDILDTCITFGLSNRSWFVRTFGFTCNTVYKNRSAFFPWIYRVSQKKLTPLLFIWISNVSVFFDSPCSIRNFISSIKQRFNHCSFVYIYIYIYIYTGCIKKKVIELQRAIIRESLGVWTIGFHYWF
jgi:hypothetical protein